MAGYWGSDWFSSIFGFNERHWKKGSLVLEGSQLRSTVRGVTRKMKKLIMRSPAPNVCLKLLGRGRWDGGEPWLKLAAKEMRWHRGSV